MNTIVIKYTFVNLEMLSLMTHSRIHGWKFPFFSPKFPVSVADDTKEGGEMSTGEFRQISVKIGEKSAACEKSAKCSKKSPRPNFGLYRLFFGKFPDISYQFSRAQDTKSVQFFYKKKKKNIRCYLVIWSWFAGKGRVFQPGSKIVDLGFVKFKSNGTKAKRP